MVSLVKLLSFTKQHLFFLNYLRLSKPLDWVVLSLRSLLQIILRKPIRYAAASVDLAKQPSLGVIFGERPVLYNWLIGSRCNVILGWGRKGSGKRALEIGSSNKCKFLLVEDGFLRSVERSAPSLSFVVDDIGIYFDANFPSRMEKLIKRPLTVQQNERTRSIIDSWRKLRLSKYNSQSDYEGELPRNYVLLIDQVADDASIVCGNAKQSSFRQMLEVALTENPSATIIVKTHPDVYTRKKKGHFDLGVLRAMKRVQLVINNCSPVRLIENAEVIYTVTSQIGFEALIWGKRVRCFGMPFYAGWGLTVDQLPAPGRSGKAGLEQLVYAALVDYPRYVDPERLESCKAETVMQHIGLQRRLRQRFPATIYAYGFSPWKRPILKKFLHGSEVRFVNSTKRIPNNTTVALWGNTKLENMPKDVNILRIEDGFLRSCGLGADLNQPLSWVIDDQGMYYDSTKVSRLETILQSTNFSAADLIRAKLLGKKIDSYRVTKYNLAGEEWSRPQTSQRVILVVGQVENDNSLKYGATSINTNIGLLRAVRKRNPAAYIVYKPHPDVVSGLRRRGESEQNANQWCDQIVKAVCPAKLLGQVDELHTLTSLFGFEALLRGVVVSCYGQPFYAGWGLTTDITAIERRTRKLTLEELIAGVLIHYPTYVSRVTNVFTTPERVVDELIEWSDYTPSRLASLRRWALTSVLRIWAMSGLRRNA